MIYKVWHHNDRLHSPWLHSISNAIPVYIQHGILAPLGSFFVSANFLDVILICLQQQKWQSGSIWTILNFQCPWPIFPLVCKNKANTMPAMSKCRGHHWLLEKLDSFDRRSKLSVNYDKPKPFCFKRAFFVETSQQALKLRQFETLPSLAQLKISLILLAEP